MSDQEVRQVAMTLAVQLCEIEGFTNDYIGTAQKIYNFIIRVK